MIPVLANNAPAPHLPYLILVAGAPLLIVAITVLAGGYGVMRARAEAAGKAYGRWFPWILAGLLFPPCAIGADLGAMAGFVFGLVALIRALELTYFAARALGRAETRPAWLEGRGAGRLFAGALLALATAGFVTTGTAAFNEWQPMPAMFHHGLREVAAWEIAYGRTHRGPDGAPRYVAPAVADGEGGTIVLGTPTSGGLYTRFQADASTRPGSYNRSYALDFRLGAEGRSFVAEAYPTRFPPAPFHLAVSLPTYRTDESGRLRSVQVTVAGARCPADAPVEYEVPEDRVARFEAELLKYPDSGSPASAPASAPAPASATAQEEPR